MWGKECNTNIEQNRLFKGETYSDTGESLCTRMVFMGRTKMEYERRSLSNG